MTKLCRLGALVGMYALPALAQVPQPTPTPPDPLAGVPVQVIQQQQVTVGTQTITLNRIAPPTFPPATPTPAPHATPATNVHAPNRTSRTLRTERSPRDAADENDLPFDILLVSATVYDHQFTELSWYGDSGGPVLSVYVNADFNYFGDIGVIATNDASYELIMGLGNETVESLIQAGGQPPNLAAFPAGYTSYQIVTGNAAAQAGDLEALDAFLSCYDANQAQLIAAYQQQQAAEAAQQQWLQTHPPVQPNTVINYWPIKSAVYLPPGN